MLQPVSSQPVWGEHGTRSTSHSTSGRTPAEFVEAGFDKLSRRTSYTCHLMMCIDSWLDATALTIRKIRCTIR